MARQSLPAITATERLDAIVAATDGELATAAAQVAADLLAIGETALEGWVRSRAMTPSTETVEGFRLLALHRQGARGEPSFNACRETCRELVYLFNCVTLSPGRAEVPRQLRLAAMVARHLVLFIDGKLETAGLGEFCCSSRPLRHAEAASTAAGTS